MTFTDSSCPYLDQQELSFELSPIERFLLCHEEDVLDYLMWWMPWPDLTRLSSTSRIMRDSISMYRKRAWAADEFFFHWFGDDFNRFRSVLALTGAVVAGEPLIRFFDRISPGEDTDLDIVTRVGGAGALVLFLERIGYQLESDAPSTHSESNPAMSQVFGITSSLAFDNRGWTNGVLAVLAFTRPLGSVPTTWIGPTYERFASIRVVIVAQDPVDHIMLSYHSSEYSLALALSVDTKPE